ncbi:albusnodin/ikarugamycin family macrolactam cyclase [Nocardiopsis sp. NPDC049922]|uniref:albusnodin/ikarugamycin family macrolactam cyclase n=1 Tax=Nocardiopsis sp. NPDC049922 TaxID=3155157 RepID=UPI0033FBD4B9
MRYFGGSFAPGGGPLPLPSNARWKLGRSSGNVWTTSGTLQVQVAEVPPQHRWAAVIGTHDVTKPELERWLGTRSGTPTAPPAWPGSYTVVVGDELSVSVFADPAHAAPIYYTEVNGVIVWASSSYALSGLVRVDIDVDWMTCLVLDPAGFDPADRSAFKGIAMVPPGHRLDLGVSCPATVRRWWSTPRPVHPNRAAAALRRALEDAVNLRLRESRTVSFDLSGGLDSTSLCLLAAERAMPGQRLIACTVRPENVGHGGDLDHARAALTEHGNIQHLVIPLGGDSAPYAEFMDALATDEPAPSTITKARHQRGYELVVAHGSTVHVSGDGGDGLLMQSPEHTLRLARRGRLLRALRDLHGWAKLNRVSPARLAGDMAYSRRRPSLPQPWLTPRALERCVRHPLRSPGSGTELAGLVGVGRTARADVQVADESGVRLENPFLDRTVIEAALKFPITHRGSPWEYKPQITTAMADVLPPAVLHRRTKGGTDADHHRGLRANLDSVLDLADGWLASHGIIDPCALRTELRRAASGRATAWGLLEPVIASEVWARSVESASSPDWGEDAERSEALT